MSKFFALAGFLFVILIAITCFVFGVYEIFHSVQLTKLGEHTEAIYHLVFGMCLLGAFSNSKTDKK